jgi:hypothetical protein
MLGQLGFKVQRLVRIRLGPLTLRGVKPGSYRELRGEDLAALRKALSAPRPEKRVTRTPGPKPVVFSRFTVTPASKGTTAPGKPFRKKDPVRKKPVRKTSPTLARMTKKGAPS